MLEAHAAGPPSAEAVRASFARARDFVARHGGALARLRLEVTLAERPPGVWIAALAARQRDDGALAAGEGATQEGVASTMAIVSELGTLRLLDEEVARRAVGFLCAAQQPDGGWSPDAPARQGAALLRDADSLRVAFSARVAGALARARHAPPRVLDAAARFLARGFAPERLEGGDWDALAGFAQFYASCPDEMADAALQWCGRELERGFRSGRLGALDTARVLVLCDARALPGARLGATQIVTALLAEQREDGGWLDGGREPALRVAATLEAVVALLRLGAPDAHAAPGVRG